MPVLDIKQIHSFSSEDPFHHTTNILTLNSNKTWRCKDPGEKTAYIVLQLERENLITGISIGNENSAFIEIFSGRTGSNETQFEVLMPTSSFMTPIESRNLTMCNRVRMFIKDQFAAETRNQKWDLIKIVCTQPFNTHITYGLSFVKIEGAMELQERFVKPNKTAMKNSEQMIGRFRFREASPEDNSFCTGSLFARRKELMQSRQHYNLKPAVAIREACTSENQHQFNTSKPPRVPIHMANIKNKNEAVGDIKSNNRNREKLLYEDEDMKSNERLDKLLQRDKNKRESLHRENELSELKSKKIKTVTKLINEKSKKDIKEAGLKVSSASEGTSPSGETLQHIYPKHFNSLFEDVVFVLSGFENPLRTSLRKMALDMGGTYQSDWNSKCTHLICAFPNTPKYHQVLGKGIIVRQKWIEDCYSQRKRLSFQSYNLVCKGMPKNYDDNDKKVLDTSQSMSIPKCTEGYSRNQNSTDVNKKLKKVDFDQNVEDPFEMSTEIEEDIVSTPNNFFNNKTFFLDESLGVVAIIKLRNFIIKFGGKLNNSLISDVHYNITVNKERSLQGIPNVRPEWVYECDDMEMLLPTHRYEL